MDGIHLMTSTLDDSVGNQGLDDTGTAAHVGSGDGWSVLLFPAALPTWSPALAATCACHLVTQLQYLLLVALFTRLMLRTEVGGANTSTPLIWGLFTKG